jgi:hypothetical protein
MAMLNNQMVTLMYNLTIIDTYNDPNYNYNFNIIDSCNCHVLSLTLTIININSHVPYYINILTY